jgi:hypothetical protein
MMMSYGQIYFPINAEWIEKGEDEIFNWTGDPDEDDDTIDILSDAASELTPRVAQKLAPPERKVSLPHGISTQGGHSPLPHWGLR